MATHSSWLLRIGTLALLMFPSVVAAQHGSSPKPINKRIQVQVRYPDGSAAGNGVLVELEYQNTEMVSQDQQGVLDDGGDAAGGPVHTGGGQ